MKKYIEAETISKKIGELSSFECIKSIYMPAIKSRVLKIIAEEPAANVEQTIHCAECRYAYFSATGNFVGSGFCHRDNVLCLKIYKDSFCSFGKKSEIGR